MYVSSVHLQDFPKHYMLLVHTPTARKVHAYPILEQIYSPIIFLAVSHPAHNIHTTLERCGISKNISYIDTLSQRIDAGLLLEGCTYTNSSDYGAVLKAIEEVNQQLPMQDNVLVVDALHHLLLREDRATAVQFIRFLRNRLNVLRLNSIFFVDLERLHPEVRKELTSMSDGVLTP